MAVMRQDGAATRPNILYTRDIPLACGLGDGEGPAASRTNPAGSRAGQFGFEAGTPEGLRKSRRDVRVFAGTAVPMRQLRVLVGAACSLEPGQAAGLARFIMIEARSASVMSPSWA